MFVAANIILIVATMIALPIGKRGGHNGGRNNGAFVFGKVENLTTWPAGWGFHACMAESNLDHWCFRLLCSYQVGYPDKFSHLHLLIDTQ